MEDGMTREWIEQKGDTVSGVVYIHQVGWEACGRGHSFGPAVRDHFLIHCILEGEGTFSVGNKEYRLNRGEGFLIVPGVVTYYRADRNNPWKYCWVGFNGTEAAKICSQCGISLEHPAFSYADPTRMETCMRELREICDSGSNEFLTLSRLYEFFSMIQREAAPAGKRAGIVEPALDYISKNYSYGITVGQIASHLGISRSHLFRVFKGKLGLSVQEYLLSFRLKRAGNLMETTDMTIKEVMYSCGFNDLPNFSRQFRKVYGMPPGAYRSISTGQKAKI
jgi:AraC-like DNA-binding protein